MTTKHQDCIVPQVPPKSPVKISDHAEKVFCSALQVYLNKMGAHPVLHKDLDFQKFLEGEAVSAFFFFLFFS